MPVAGFADARAGAGCVLIFWYSLVARLPASCRLVAQRCTASITSSGCARKASPRRLHPTRILAERGEHLRERDERLHARIPRWSATWRTARVAVRLRIRLDPRGGIGDIARIRRRHQHLREQRIGIQRDAARPSARALRRRNTRSRRGGGARPGCRGGRGCGRRGCRAVAAAAAGPAALPLAGAQARRATISSIQGAGTWRASRTGMASQCPRAGVRAPQQNNATAVSKNY
jgi:hypothetical protein